MDFKNPSSEMSLTRDFDRVLLERDRAVPKARSGRNRRQEGRECSYYDLHCYLNNTLFHFLSLSVSSALPLTGVWH